jgi:hypothetical protein
MGAMDGGEHSPQETFDFMTQLMTVSRIARNPAEFTTYRDVEAALKASRAEEFEHLFRSRRGMPEGIVLPKDLAYLGGKVKAINLINRTPLETTELYDYWASGKFNPLIADQATLAYQLWRPAA